MLELEIFFEFHFDSEFPACSNGDVFRAIRAPQPSQLELNIFYPGFFHCFRWGSLCNISVLRKLVFIFLLVPPTGKKLGNNFLELRIYFFLLEPAYILEVYGKNRETDLKLSRPACSDFKKKGNSRLRPRVWL